MTVLVVGLALCDVVLCVLWFRAECHWADALDDLRLERMRPRRSVLVTRYVAYSAEDALTMMLADQATED